MAIRVSCTHEDGERDSVHAGEHDVGNDNLRTERLRENQGRFSIVGGSYLVAFGFKNKAQCIGYYPFVIDYENTAGGGGAHSFLPAFQEQVRSVEE